MNKKGFTLVELLVVVAIIGILSVILVPNVQESLKRAKVARTKALISTLEMSIEQYRTDRGQYPASYDPQLLYIALTEQSRNVYEPDSDEIKMFYRGDKFWVKQERSSDTRREDILSSIGVPSNARTAQMDENVFIDAWDNPLYYISHEEYNKAGRTDFRTAGRNKIPLDKACAYEVRDGRRYKPFKPTSFQIISFGPDETSITPSSNNGGIGSMISTDKIDNDGDGYIDHLDQVRNPGSNGPDAWAEDDVTNFM